MHSAELPDWIHERFQGALASVVEEAHANCAFIGSGDGSVLHAVQQNSRIPQVAQRAAEAIASSEGLRNLISKEEFSILFHRGDDENIHVTPLTEDLFLAVIFDPAASLGQGRFVARKFRSELLVILNASAS